MENKDEHLWQIAKKRAGFKKHLATYIIVNAFLWSIWWITDRNEDKELLTAWPIWTSLGWGVGIAFGYYNAYHNNREEDTMKEFQKLKDKENKL